MLLRIQVCEQDQTDFGLPAELMYDHDKVAEMKASELRVLEQEMGGYSIRGMVLEAQDESADAMKAIMWLAAKQANNPIGFAAFDPHLMKTRFDWIDSEDDALPPEGGPGNGDSADTPT